MAKKKYTPQSMKMLLAQHAGVREHKQQYTIPFRSDILNLLLGGVSTSMFTEISGDPNMFKSTIAAEIIINALMMNAVCIVHDKERKLIESRFTTLGTNAFASPNFHYIEDEFPEYRLTIEQYFTDMLRFVEATRYEDLDRIRKQFSNDKKNPSTANDGLYDYYRRYLPLADRDHKRTEARCNKIADQLKTPNLLRPEDKTLILTVLDSTTAVPSKEEAYDPKTGEVPDPNPALQARVWSQFLRTCLWMDDRVAALHLSQKRLKLNFTGNSYERAAVTRSQEYYYTTRIMLAMAANGKLYRHPTTGEIVIGDSGHALDQKINQIGQITRARIMKSLTGIKTEIPLFMLGQTGTDRINSMWEFLLQRNLIKHYHGGRWHFNHPLFDAIWDPNTVKFKRTEFIDLYVQDGAKLGRVLEQYKNLLLTGREEEPEESTNEMPLPPTASQMPPPPAME